MNLTHDNIQKIFIDSMYRPDELPPNVNKNCLPADAVIAEGVMNTVVFNPVRLELHREEVKEMLSQLSDDFMKNLGGGMSLMRMVADKHGNLYGEQITADQLYILGNALGYAKWVLPREMWDALPGSVPYIVIDLS